MESKLSFTGRYLRLGFVLAAGVAACLLGPATARADLIVSVQSVTAVAGSSANGIDVELSNLGPSAVTIGGFSFGISIANLDISFTGANISTAAPYIFGADSLFGPDLTGPTSGQSLSTADLFSIPFSGITLGAGTTVGLGHVLFDVLPNAASGSFPVDLALFPTTSLSDESGNDVPIDTLSSGQITITSSVVPVPSSLSLLLCGVGVLAVTMGWRRGEPAFNGTDIARGLQNRFSTDYPPEVVSAIRSRRARRRSCATVKVEIAAVGPHMSPTPTGWWTLMRSAGRWQLLIDEEYDIDPTSGM